MKLARFRTSEYMEAYYEIESCFLYKQFVATRDNIHLQYSVLGGFLDLLNVRLYWIITSPLPIFFLLIFI